VQLRPLDPEHRPSQEGGLAAVTAGHFRLIRGEPEIIERHADKVAAFSKAKGTLDFTPDHPIPRDLIELIVRERMAAIDDRRGSERG
jgi:uncharacterized protein YdhG (YjbR/CyaY superfamily)